MTRFKRNSHSLGIIIPYFQFGSFVLQTIDNDIYFNIFPDCSLCIPRSSAYVGADGVMNFPRKSKKASARQQLTVVVIVQVLVDNKKIIHRYWIKIVAIFREIGGFVDS
jgi:hypothetical protein